MKLWNHIRSSNFLIKLSNWEYWPFEIIYAPVFIYWLYLSIKARSLFFFSAANPGIETGGLIGESKIKILQKVPKQYLPKTIYVPHGEAIDTVVNGLNSVNIDFPLIAKPNIGSRGFLVKKIIDISELKNYLGQQNVDFLLQEFIDYPMELSILYYRFPNELTGSISSVTIKRYLTVKGDGQSTVMQLIKRYDRAKLQLDTLRISHKGIMDQVPGKDEIIELVPFGNHCRGAAFFNGSHLIDENLIATFDRISHQLDGIYYGRYDIKCSDIDSLRRGKYFKILEINGVGAEPAHIYDPDYHLFQAFKDILRQWKIIYQISMFNRRQGTNFMSLPEAYQTLTSLFAYRRLARS